jgi:hypothetical protein
MRFLLITLFFAATACSSRDSAPTALEDESSRQQAVTAAFEGQTLVVRNGADFPVRIAVLETVYVTNALALWCFGSDQCGTLLAANSTVRIPITQVEGYAPGMEEVLVHWWNPADPDRRPDEGAPVQKFSVQVA